MSEIEWCPVYRVRYPTDPSNGWMQKPHNDNVAAVIQLQEQVEALLARVAALEAQTFGGLLSAVSERMRHV